MAFAVAASATVGSISAPRPADPQPLAFRCFAKEAHAGKTERAKWHGFEDPSNLSAGKDEFPSKPPTPHDNLRMTKDWDVTSAATHGYENPSWVDTSVELDDLDLEDALLDDEQERITGALQIGLIGFRRPASWVCFGGGARPRRPRAWKTKNRRGTEVKSRKLVDLISTFPSSKEEVYGGLDAWCAWELEFPIVALKKALKILQSEQQWKRVIQVTKWMLSKGQGKTMGTYLLLLQALDHEGRVEEADALWEKLLTENEECTPRIMFTCVMAMFEHHGQPKRLLQVFADMEELEVRPDMVTVERVARTYRSLGLVKRAEQVTAKYQPPTFEVRYYKGRRIKVRVDSRGKAVPGSDQSHQSGEEGRTEDPGSDDEDFEELESEDEDFVYEEQFEAKNHDSEGDGNLITSAGSPH